MSPRDNTKSPHGNCDDEYYDYTRDPTPERQKWEWLECWDELTYLIRRYNQVIKPREPLRLANYQRYSAYGLDIICQDLTDQLDRYERRHKRYEGGTDASELALLHL